MPAEKVREAFTEPVKQKQQLIDALGLVEFEFAIPANVYGSASMIGILFENNTWLEWFERSGQCYIRLYLNVIIQLFLIADVYQLVVWNWDIIDGNNAAAPEDQGECYNLSGKFLFFNLLIFFTAVLTEIFETCCLAEVIIRRVPAVEGTSRCLVYSNSEAGPVLVDGGMNVLRKACVCIFVLLPKLALGVAMIIIGGLFLTSSASNTDLLLNSLAAVFIIEIDEMIYTLFGPGHIKRLIEAIPPFEIEHSPIYSLIRRAKFLIVLLLTLLLVLIFQSTARECATDPCTGAIRACPAIPFLTT